jgi:DNA-directed RNA polymerase specialized sigma24 family protein
LALTRPETARSSDTWTLHRAALAALVERLGPAEEGARAYETLRRKLIAFLDWRGAAQPEAAADETLDRVARKLEEGVPIANMRAYALGIARHVLQEAERRERREHALHRSWSELRHDGGGSEEGESLQCLARCLGALSADDRALIVRYHRADDGESREAMARQLGLSYGTLRTRAHRIRTALARCIVGCLDAASGAPAGTGR